MYNNQTLQNLQQAINENEYVDNKIFENIVLNIAYCFSYFIERGDNNIISVNTNINDKDIVIKFEEKHLPWDWNNEYNSPIKNVSLDEIIISKNEISNIKNIISEALKKHDIEFYDDLFLDLTNDCLPQCFESTNTKYNDENEKSKNISTWQDAKDYPDKYAKMIVDNYIEVFNLMSDEKFSDEQKKLVLLKLDLCNNKFKNNIKEVLDTMYPNIEINQKEVNLEI